MVLSLHIPGFLQNPWKQRCKFNSDDDFAENGGWLREGRTDEIFEVTANSAIPLARFDHFSNEVEPAIVKLEISLGPVVDSFTFFGLIDAKCVEKIEKTRWVNCVSLAREIVAALTRAPIGPALRDLRIRRDRRVTIKADQLIANPKFGHVLIVGRNERRAGRRRRANDGRRDSTRSPLPGCRAAGNIASL